MKVFLLLSVLVSGHVEITVIQTDSEQNCAFVAEQMRKAMEFPVIDPAAPRVVGAECSDAPPAEAAALPPPELRL
jgi:hypothetical protein